MVSWHAKKFSQTIKSSRYTQDKLVKKYKRYKTPNNMLNFIVQFTHSYINQIILDSFYPNTCHSIRLTKLCTYGDKKNINCFTKLTQTMLVHIMVIRTLRLSLWQDLFLLLPPNHSSLHKYELLIEFKIWSHKNEMVFT